MKHFARNLFVAVLGYAGIFASPLLAREEIPAETRLYPFSANLPACESDHVLSRIQGRFNRIERNFWGGTVEIVGFENVRQAAFRPHGLDLIPRRYCQGVAMMSNNRRHAVRFAIIEDAGAIGLFNDVQFCIDEYDRNHTAMPGCQRLDR